MDYDKEIEEFYSTAFQAKKEEEKKEEDEEKKEKIILEHVHIDVKIDSLEDLIQLANDAVAKYDYTNPKKRFNIDFPRLCAIKQDMQDMCGMIGMHKLKKSIVDHILYYLQDLHKSSPEKYIQNTENNTTVPVTNTDEIQDYKHMVLTGPPGVGKTEVAKIVARLFLNMGLLKNNVFKKATRTDLIGGFLGQTAIKTNALVQSCLGGVLFIDEAYSLWDPSREKQDSYAREAVDTLCEAMSDHRNDLMVIFAGYEKEINAFLEANKGMESRFLWRYTVEPYTASELLDIFKKKVLQSGWSLLEDIDSSTLWKKWFETRHKRFTACGRDIEKLLTFAKIAHARRVFGLPRTACKVLSVADLDAGYVQLLANRKEEDVDGFKAHQFYFV